MSTQLQTHWLPMENILRYLPGTIEFGIEFEPKSLHDVSTLYVDNWGSHIDARSKFGLIVHLGANPIIWAACK